MAPKRRSSRVTFNPKHFQTAGTKDTAKSRRVIFKGAEEYHVDPTEVETDIRYLRSYADEPLKTIGGDLKGCYERVTSYVALMHNTELYQSFIDMVTKHFRDLEDPIPGTIGGYMAGCLGYDGNYPPSCSPICAGSIPNGKDNRCQYQVMEAKRKGKDRHFTFEYVTVGDRKNDDTAYIYVDYGSTSAFPGFCNRDRQNLKRKGIRRVCIWGKIPNDNRYANITDGIVGLDKVKASVSYESGRIHNTGLDGGTIGLMLFFLIFLIALVVIALGNRRKTKR